MQSNFRSFDDQIERDKYKWRHKQDQSSTTDAAKERSEVRRDGCVYEHNIDVGGWRYASGRYVYEYGYGYRGANWVGAMGRGDWKGYLWIRWVEYVDVECGMGMGMRN